MRLTPTIKRTADFIESKIRNNGFTGVRLPPIPHLARMAGVSAVTALKGIAVLKERGVVSTVRGHYTVINKAFFGAPLGDDVHCPECAQSVWEKLRGTLEREVWDGCFTDRFPSLKELAVKHHVSLPTARKACEALCADEVLIAHGRGYGLPVFHAESSEEIELFVYHDRRVLPLRLGHLNDVFLRQVETVCARSGVRLRIVLFSPERDGVTCVRHATGEPFAWSESPKVIGRIYLVNSSAAVCDDLMRTFAHMRTPTAILDEIGGWKRPGYLDAAPRVKTFSISGSRACGTAIGRFLLSLGHRRIAFISAYHAAPGSRMQIDGLRAAYRSEEGSSAVALYAIDDRADSTQYLTDARTRCDTEALMAGCNAWKLGLPRDYDFSVDRTIAFLTRKTIWEGEINHRLQPLFKRALQAGDATAWVCADDLTASLALTFLRDRKVRVPNDISVIGYGDTMGALTRSLTSFNFNVEGAVETMMRYLLRPTTLGRAGTRTRIDIRGSVVRRESVARAK